MTHEGNEYLSEHIVNSGESEEDFNREGEERGEGYEHDLRDDESERGEPERETRGGDEREVTLPPDTVVREPEGPPGSMQGPPPPEEGEGEQ